MDFSFRPRIAIIDDDKDILQLLTRMLQKEFEGVEITSFHEAPPALEQLKQNKFNIVVTDIHMPDAYGDDILRTIISLKQGVQVIVITGDMSMAPAITCFRNGARHYFRKPIDKKSFLKAIGDCMENLKDWQKLFEVHAAKQMIEEDDLETDSSDFEDVSDFES